MYPDSLVCRYCGLHAVRLSPEQRWITILVQINVARPKRQQLETNLIYDVKGSTFSRKVLSHSSRESVRRLCAATEPDAITGRDLDMTAKLDLGAEGKALMTSVLSQDVSFLNRLGLMDYSLLIAIAIKPRRSAHDDVSSRPRPRARELRSAVKGQFCGVDCEATFGIIDILQQYDLGKRIETFYKVYALRNPLWNVSSAPPDVYAQRFLAAVQAKLQ